jgi:hypothetical protein
MRAKEPTEYVLRAGKLRHRTLTGASGATSVQLGDRHRPGETSEAEVHDQRSDPPRPARAGAESIKGGGPFMDFILDLIELLW